MLIYYPLLTHILLHHSLIFLKKGGNIWYGTNVMPPPKNPVTFCPAYPDHLIKPLGFVCLNAAVVRFLEDGTKIKTMMMPIKDVIKNMKKKNFLDGSMQMNMMSGGAGIPY